MSACSNYSIPHYSGTVLTKFLKVTYIILGNDLISEEIMFALSRLLHILFSSKQTFKI